MGARLTQNLSQACPNCGAPALRGFFELAAVPVHSVMLLTDKREALSFPTGDIRLAHCTACDFITNTVFDADLQSYGEGYEATQAFSPTFNAFHAELAKDLIGKYNLRGKNLIEIGCGQGEFLTLLCELGGNRGVGFDPAYVGAAGPVESDDIRFVADFYSETYADVVSDFVCCKMTLEHIRETGAFVETVRRAVDGRSDTLVFFQVPECRRILDEMAFWDIYYEHCSYFTEPSLRRLFARSGFDVIDSYTRYDDQYLMIEARPARAATEENVSRGKESGIGAAIQQFGTRCQERIEAWRRYLRGRAAAGRRVAVWGGGSKAVAFLTALKVDETVADVVDINPRKHGTFLPGTGHRVMGPESLRKAPPDVAIVMNPIYIPEIDSQLKTMGLAVELLPVTADVSGG